MKLPSLILLPSKINNERIVSNFLPKFMSIFHNSSYNLVIITITNVIIIFILILFYYKKISYQLIAIIRNLIVIFIEYFRDENIRAAMIFNWLIRNQIGKIRYILFINNDGFRFFLQF